MKVILLTVLASISLRVNLFAQKDFHSPISVSVKVEREYDVTYPKTYFTKVVREENVEINTDSVVRNHYDIEVSIHNNSTRPISIWLMTCGWERNFLINNYYMSFVPKNCDANYPHQCKIEKGKPLVYRTIIAKSIRFKYGSQGTGLRPEVAETKLGLIVIDDGNLSKCQWPFSYDLAMQDKSHWKIVWSNPLYLLTEEEASRPLYFYDGNGIK